MGMSGYWDIESGEELTDDELESRYDDWLDEISSEVTIGSLTYSASRVLKEVDPIAYRVGLSEYTDFELGESLSEEPPADAE